jgi:EamA domain-containing membrane protein RarD
MNIIIVTAALLSAMGVATVFGILLLRPNQDNTQLILGVLGYLTPTLISILALLKSTENKENIENLHNTVNARTSDLVKVASQIEQFKESNGT